MCPGKYNGKLCGFISSIVEVGCSGIQPSLGLREQVGKASKRT